MGIPRTSRIGYGLMNLTWRPTPIADKDAFATIKAAVDAGCAFLNTGEFYGERDPEDGLKLLARFYAAYPQYVDKTYVSVKGGLSNWQPDASYEGLRVSVMNINKKLGGVKKMDLFEISRRDPTRSIQEAMHNLMRLRDEGYFQDIGLSEVNANSIRQAAAVGPIAAVEVEYSPFTLDVEQNGVLEACRQLGIPIVNYCPLGKGLLDPKIRQYEDIPDGDHRQGFPRFQPGALEKNLALAEKFREVGKRKGYTGVQICLAWEIAQDPLFYPIPGSTRVEGVLEAAKANEIRLSEAEVAEIRQLVNEADLAGERYPSSNGHDLNWG